MIARKSCLAAAFSLALLAAPASLGKSTAAGDGMGPPAAERDDQPPSQLAEIHTGGTLKSLTLVSVSREGMDVYKAELGHGHVELDLTSLDRGGKAEVRSFDLRY